MAMRDLDWLGFLWRFLAAVVLVFATYNPEGYSFFHWVVQDLGNITPWKVLAGIVLLIGWTVFLSATRSSLGALGIILAIALFAALLWLVVDLGIIPLDSTKALTYLILFAASCVLAIGLMWSHIRRRLTGQVDVDEMDD